MPRSLLALPALILIASLPAKAAPQATIQSGWSTAGGSRVWCDGFAQDEVSLIVSDHGKTLGKDEFCSAYGEATTSVVQDMAKATYIIVEYAEGRGTNATTKFLSLYRLYPSLIEMIRIPISWGTGPTQRFTYSYRIKSQGVRGLRILFNGKADPGSQCCVPSRTDLTIDIEN